MNPGSEPSPILAILLNHGHPGSILYQQPGKTTITTIKNNEPWKRTCPIPAILLNPGHPGSNRPISATSKKNANQKIPATLKKKNFLTFPRTPLLFFIFPYSWKNSLTPEKSPLLFFYFCNARFIFPMPAVVS